ncbi:MAG: NAD(P)-dependent alcohol dehydrogenase [Myxococcota bacterium]
MRALRYHRYGGIDVLQLEDAPPPPLGSGQIRVQVQAVALNPKDALFRKGRFRRLSGGRFPKTPGLDFAGQVLEDPSGRLPRGARVFGAIDEWRFLRGTFAEELVVAPRELAILPPSVSTSAGAATGLAGLTALQALRDLGRVGAGTRVLINGASGGVGTFAIQIGVQLGAVVDTISSAANTALARSLGAAAAFAYDRQEHPTERYDLVFDVYGNLPAAKARPWIGPRGVWVGTVPNARTIVADLASRLLPLRQRLVVVRSSRRDLETLAGWLASGRLRAVIDRELPFADFREAFGRLESRRTQGKIILRVDSASLPG